MTKPIASSWLLVILPEGRANRERPPVGLADDVEMLCGPNEFSPPQVRRKTSAT
jgi:hypothetical protein